VRISSTTRPNPPRSSGNAEEPDRYPKQDIQIASGQRTQTPARHQKKATTERDLSAATSWPCQFHIHHGKAAARLTAISGQGAGCYSSRAIGGEIAPLCPRQFLTIPVTAPAASARLRVALKPLAVHVHVQHGHCTNDALELLMDRLWPGAWCRNTADGHADSRLHGAEEHRIG